MKLTLTIGFLLTILTLSYSLFARQPAVEPIMGISMDELSKATDQKVDAGFSFTKGSHPSSVNSSVTIEKKSTPWIPQAIILALLPVAIVLVTRFKMKKHALKSLKVNTIDFEAAKNKRVDSQQETKKDAKNEKPSQYKKAS